MDKFAELEKIAKLHEQGFLTATEFAAQKARILSGNIPVQKADITEIGYVQVAEPLVDNTLFGFPKNIVFAIATGIFVLLVGGGYYVWANTSPKLTEAEIEKMRADSLAQAQHIADSMAQIVADAKAQGKAEGIAEANVGAADAAASIGTYDSPLYCTGININMREQPNLSAEVVAKLECEEQVGFLYEKKTDSRGAIWCRVTKYGTEGWVSEKLLSANPNFKKTWKKYNIKDNYAALYQNDESAHGAGKVEQSQRFTVCERSGSYNRFLVIMPDETRGYIYGKDIAW